MLNNIGDNTPPCLTPLFKKQGEEYWSEIANFRSVFARSASAVTPSEKSSIKTNSKSTIRLIYILLRCDEGRNNSINNLKSSTLQRGLSVIAELLVSLALDVQRTNTVSSVIYSDITDISELTSVRDRFLP